VTVGVRWERLCICVLYHSAAFMGGYACVLHYLEHWRYVDTLRVRFLERLAYMGFV
jgi:hypothetical protein